MTTEEIGNDTPLRLNEAAKIAFPRGGVTAATLRKEAKHGKLVILEPDGEPGSIAVCADEAFRSFPDDEPPPVGTEVVYRIKSFRHGDTYLYAATDCRLYKEGMIIPNDPPVVPQRRTLIGGAITFRGG